MNNDQVHTGHHGLTIWTTAVFVVGEIAGGGVLALPRAVEDTGWIGLPLLLIFTITSTYTGTLIGKIWILIQNEFPEYRDHVPDPYPVIGEKTYGRIGKHAVTFSINFTLFGASTVYLILASENIEDLMSHVTKDISFCYWLLILGCILIPITCLGTPKDFWAIGVAATLSTGIACILILIQVLLDKPNVQNVEHSSTDIMKFSSAFGTIVFSVSGHPAFPTFLSDMKKKSDFKWAIIVGYAIVLLMYLPTTSSGYFVYGSRLNANILKTMKPGAITIIVEILITLHLIFAFLILINPVCQELESKFGVPKGFTWKRCIARPVIVLLVMFVGETVPHFGAILSLVGGSTTTLLSYILPCLFYLKMCKISSKPLESVHFSTNKENKERISPTIVSEKTPLLNEHSAGETDSNLVNGQKDDLVHRERNRVSGGVVVPFWEKLINYEIILVGTIAGIAATISSVKDLVSPGTFTVPCYLNATRA